jgi:hypothetical protein
MSVISNKLAYYLLAELGVNWITELPMENLEMDI